MTDHGAQLPWDRPGWLEEATTWILEQLGRHGLRAGGPVEQARVRAWSIVLRVPLASGALYFKATTPMDRYEVPLLSLLARFRPASVPRLLATDTERGWLLLADAGQPLRTLVRAESDWRRWLDVVRTYAELQLEAASHVDEMLTCGVPDCRPTALPGALQRLLADEEVLRIGRPEGLTAGEYARLTTLAPLLAERCARLERYGIPVSVDHSDFHDGNVFLDDDRPVLIDWGDACVAHPFCSLLVTFRSIAHSLGIDEQSPELSELRQQYLAPWHSFAPADALRDAFALAQWPAMLIRALSWQRALAPLSGPEREEHADAVPAWLRDFLEAARA